MKKETTIKYLKNAGVVIVAITTVTFWVLLGYVTLSEDSDTACSDGNVAVVKMYGVIDIIDDGDYISVDPIVEQIEQHSRNKDIELIILEVYSTGGIGSAGEAVMNALKRSPKMTVALVIEEAASAGYLAASGADKIYTTRYANVGSIGATYSYVDSTEKNAREGVHYRSISSAPFKDMFNIDKPLTTIEKQKLMDLLEDTHQTFVEMIAENRGLPVEAVAELADGSMYTNTQALESGLIDAVGDKYTILNDLSIEGKILNLCEK